MRMASEKRKGYGASLLLWVALMSAVVAFAGCAQTPGPLAETDEIIISNVLKGIYNCPDPEFRKAYARLESELVAMTEGEGTPSGAETASGQAEVSTDGAVVAAGEAVPDGTIASGSAAPSGLYPVVEADISFLQYVKRMYGNLFTAEEYDRLESKCTLYLFQQESLKEGWISKIDQLQVKNLGEGKYDILGTILYYPDASKTDFIEIPLNGAVEFDKDRKIRYMKLGDDFASAISK